MKALVCLLAIARACTAHAEPPRGLTMPRVEPSFLTADEMRAETARLGLPVDDVVFETEDDGDLNAYFIPRQVVCWFLSLCDEIPTTVAFYGDWSGAPYELRLFALYHELGHYRQALDRRQSDEWDADLFAANAMCRRGLDGVYWNYRTLDFVRTRYGVGWGAGAGTKHGSYAQRAANVELRASDCRSKAQSPLAPVAELIRTPVTDTGVGRGVGSSQNR